MYLHVACTHNRDSYQELRILPLSDDLIGFVS